MRLDQAGDKAWEQRRHNTILTTSTEELGKMRLFEVVFGYFEVLIES